MPHKIYKAYKNFDFLSSPAARTIRILSEYLEPEKRFKDYSINHTVVFFGSARSQENDPYYKAAEEFAFLLASHGKELAGRNMGYYICTGGGPGIMEAANRGARRAGMQTIGLNISLPFEQQPNQYITPELNFEFHYFFMRKLWFLYHSKALIVFPGGFGTLDELFETLTLIQTGKIGKKNLPVMLYDRAYWESTINFKKLVDMNFISPEDIELFHYFDTPQSGFEYLKPRIEDLITKVNHIFEKNRKTIG
jgi:uncharacterized protein (TIGR00730 family)